MSIVIITKNRSHLIEDCIISCLNQTYRNFELVIVDDGSTDNTEQIVRKFNDERIRYIKKESSGYLNQEILVSRNQRESTSS